MKDSKYGFVFYIAATICFLLILVYIVTDSPAISPPSEYVYWEESSSEQASSSETATTVSSEVVPNEVISSENQNNTNGKTSKTSSKISNKSSSRTSSNTVTKHYLSSTPQSSSEVVSSDLVSSELVSSDLVSSKHERESSEVQNEVSSKEPKPLPDTTSIVNINTASKEQLMSLDGIGNTISERIITFRKDIGGFNSIDEIMSVKGIGEKTFAAIKHRLTV
ncbi:MAG: helix-hairpin-helix domain-containing protein [Oscillospiraceae bacterium]